MKKKNDVEVLIDGRKYTLCGFESPEYIQKIASYINRKLAEFHKQEGYARLDLDLRNTLLAINIADDYYKEKKKASGMSVKHEYVSKLEQLADASGKSEEKTVSRKKRTEKEDKEETVYEISDLAYHVLVLMVSAGITVEDVTRELEKRHVIDHKVKQERMQ